MDTRDRFWIFTATAVAIASIGLSAFIVAFAPEDPYMPASRSALRSDRPLQIRASATTNEIRANGNVRDSRAAAEGLWSAGNDHRLGYAAFGATAGIALMFVVMGWLDRSPVGRGPDRERPDVASCNDGAAASESSCISDEDDAEFNPAIAMIALGFGAFVGRDPPPMPRCAYTATRDGTVRLDDRAIAFHRLAAGYGAAAMEWTCSENRRRADRRNPFSTRTRDTVERRRGARRITDLKYAPTHTSITCRGLSVDTRNETMH